VTTIRRKENDTEVHRRDHTTGEGRHGGRSISGDGNLNVKHAFPKEMGGAGDGTNPEQLLGAGWSACFRGALDRAASRQGIELRNVDVTAEISLFAEGDNFWLGAVLRAQAAGVDLVTLANLMDDAHLLCPYSKATRGNIEVQLVANAA
jgi:Ohr subfamily peroxiredoxin